MRPPLHTNLLQNPNFQGGSSAGWTLNSFAVGTGAPFGDGHLALYNGSVGTVGTFVANLTKIQVLPGGNVGAKCWALAELGAVGSAALRITFFDVNNQQLGINHNGPWIISNYVWVNTAVVATAPVNASYAIVDFAVYTSSTIGPRWGATQFFATYLPGAITPNQITYKQPLQYYLNLFTSQYRLSAKLNQWQAALMQPIDDLTNCLATMNVSYDIDNAIGSQLDVIGELLGVSRTVPFQPTGGVSPILTDDDYRTLLYATQAKDLWDGKTASLYPIWQFIFPGVTVVIKDHQDMTADIVSSGALTSIEKDLIANNMIVPRPETVLYNPSATTGILFGFDLNTTAVSGFDIGHFA